MSGEEAGGAMAIGEEFGGKLAGDGAIGDETGEALDATIGKIGGGAGWDLWDIIAAVEASLSLFVTLLSANFATVKLS